MGRNRRLPGLPNKLIDSDSNMIHYAIRSIQRAIAFLALVAASVLLLYSLLLVGCSHPVGPQRLINASEVWGSWMIRPEGVIMLGSDVIQSGVPRFKLLSNGKVIIRSFPKYFVFPDSSETLDGEGRWALRNGPKSQLLDLTYKFGATNNGVTLEVIISQNGAISLVKWLIEPGEGALTFECVSKL